MAETTDRYRVGQPNPEKVFIMAKRYPKYTASERFDDLPTKTKQFIVGSLMGDGGMERRGDKFAFREKHANDQQDYVYWKADEGFEEFFPRMFFEKAGPKNVQDRTMFKTTTTEIFAEIYGDIYRLNPNNGWMKKHVWPQKYLDAMGNLGFLIAYLDDGSLTKHNKIMRIAMASVENESFERIKAHIETTYGFDLKTYQYFKPGKTQPYVRDLYFPAKARNWFCGMFNELFDEHGIPDCMRHKISL